MKNIVILGAGISGLSLGWFLREHNVTIIEKSSRTGGWIQTVEQDGFLFEQGPRSCRPSGTGIETLKLIEELDLQNEVIPGNAEAKKRYLWTDQKLQPLSKILFSRFGIHLTKAILKDFLAGKTPGPDAAIYDFISRRFGEYFAENLFDPMTLGIYAGDIRTLSMRSCFPKLWEWEQKHGSILMGFLREKKAITENSFIDSFQKKSLFSFKNGMETLTKALTQRLSNRILLNCRVESLDFSAIGACVRLSNGETLEADHLFSTLPAPSLAEITDPALSKKLKELSHTSLTVVNFGFRKQVLNRKGFGYLIPSKEKEQILGVVWDSSAFPEQNRRQNETRLTVMVKDGNKNPLDTAQEAISRQMGITSTPDSTAIKTAVNCIPQYRPGHHEWLRQIKALTPPSITFLGTPFDGVSVNDCIANAKRHASGLICQKKQTQLN